MEYLECWHYVNHQTERQNNEVLRWGQAAQGWAFSAPDYFSEVEVQSIAA
jgi:hypothetical protein